MPQTLKYLEQCAKCGGAILEGFGVWAGAVCTCNVPAKGGAGPSNFCRHCGGFDPLTHLSK